MPLQGRLPLSRFHVTLISVRRFNMILCQRSFAHLRAVFDEYQKLSKKSMEDVIKSEFSGDIKDGFLTVGQCCWGRSSVGRALRWRANRVRYPLASEPRDGHFRFTRRSRSLTSCPYEHQSTTHDSTQMTPCTHTFTTHANSSSSSSDPEQARLLRQEGSRRHQGSGDGRLGAHPGRRVALRVRHGADHGGVRGALQGAHGPVDPGACGDGWTEEWVVF